jgi:hypothetical protein
MRLRSATTVLLVVFVITGIHPLSRAESLLCRRDYIAGFDNLCAYALMRFGPPTSNLADAQVLVSAKKGFLFVYTNYTERPEVHPAKLATNDAGVTLDDAIARIVYLEPAHVNMPLLKKSITLYLDKPSCEENRYTLDCSSYANVKEISTKLKAKVDDKTLVISPPAGQSPPEKKAKSVSRKEFHKRPAHVRT